MNAPGDRTVPEDQKIYELDADHVLITPGLNVEVEVVGHNVRSMDSGYRSLPLEQALSENGMETTRVFSIQVAPGEAPAVRSFETRESEEPLQLQVAAAPDQETAVLHTDENGFSSWVFAEPEETTQVRAGLPTRTFTLPPSSPSPDQQSVTTRGPLTKIGRRIVRVITWATDPLVAAGANAVFEKWESVKRPYGLRKFPFVLDGRDEPDWSQISKGPALLFIHGTFSSAYGGFSALSPETRARLEKQYEGRIFGFDHPTLHLSPDANAEMFVEMLREKLDKDATYNFDVVTHSRGGLVLRSLLANLDKLTENGPTIKIGKAVLVASPNLGTPLADGDHGVDFLDRYTNLITNLPDNLFTYITEGVLALVKIVYHGGVGGLQGLMAMKPDGDFVKTISSSSGAPTAMHAIASDFSPARDPSLQGFLKKSGNDLVDACFDKQPNDLVVPTDGGFEREAGHEDWIVEGQRLRLGETDGVHHLNYFSHPKVGKALVQWLVDQPVAEALEFTNRGIDFDADETVAESFTVGDSGDDDVTPRGVDLGAEPQGNATRAEETTLEANAPGPKPTPPARYLNAKAPPKVQLNQEFPLTVKVDLQAAAQGQGQGSTGFDGGDTGTVIAGEISIDVHAPEFRVIGPFTQKLNVPEAGPSLPVRFVLAAEKEGLHSIEITAWNGPVPVASLSVSVGVETEKPAEVESLGNMAMRDPNVGEFTLEVEFDRQKNRYCFQFRGEGYNGESVYGEELVGGQQSIYTGILKAVNAQARDLYKMSASQIERWLKGAGGQIYQQLVPKEIKNELWTRRDQIRQLNILSRDDNLPWELLYVVPDGADEVQEGYFLADRAVICRWVFGAGPVPSLHKKSPRYVVPADGPAAASDEVAMLDEILGPGDRLVSLDSLTDSLDAGKFDLLHFAAHNVQPADGASYVPMGGQRFETTLMGMYPRGKYRANAPLVFMNACTSAGSLPLYTELNGWASKFLELGCGAFVGSLWEVRDTSARAFSEAFYRALKNGKTLAEAMTAGRAAIPPGDPTRFAYTLYGNPEARLVGA